MTRYSALRMALVVLAVLAVSALPGIVSSSEYVLGTGDVISITVFGDPELTVAGPVGPDGLVSMPLVGQVLAAGRTVGELKATVERMLLPYIKDPNVNVTITTFRPLRVAVLGEVARPGAYQLQQGATVVDALAAAGDITADADADNIAVVRAGAATTLRYADIASHEAASGLSDGATVFVPRAQRQLLVLGDVVRPGAVAVPGAGTFRLLDAVAAAGGVTASAADPSNVRVDYTGQRGSSGSTTLAELIADPAAAANVQLAPGDAVIVQVLPRSATVIGEVAKPGVYPLDAGTTVLSLLASAGGLRPDVADAAHALLTTTDGMSRQLNLPLMLDGTTADIPVEAGATLFVPGLARAQVAVVGEVARPGVYEIRPGATLAELVAQAGGLTSKAAARVSVFGQQNQAEPRFEGDALASILVEDRDLIVVESRAVRVTVLGSVARPGGYELLDGATAVQAVAAAGGALNRADRIAVYTGGDIAAGARFEGSLAASPSIVDGDVIEVKPNTFRVTVLGSVTRPGSYELESGAGLPQALAAAGGLTPAADAAAATLTREGASMAVDLDVAAEAVQLADGDVLFVPQLELRATITGQVARPGTYELKPGARVMDLIAAAGGVVNGAERIAVFSAGDMAVARFEGAVTANPSIGAGDIVEVKSNTIRVTVLGKVARPGTYELRDDAGVVQALAAAGGLAVGADGAAATLTRGAESVVVDLSSTETATPVADGDVLFVPETESRALVIGQVVRPGAYDVKPGARAMDLIAAAGGTLNRADRIAVFAAGDMTAARFEGSLTENPFINAGDIIEVKPNTIRVTVLGSVARPGSYELQAGARIVQALAAAGGVTEAADASAATLTRDGVSTAVDLDVAAEPVLLVDGDVLFVPQLEVRATVAGQVARPGAYELKSGARVMDLIAAAGGVLNRADKIAVYAGGDMSSPSFEGSLADNPAIEAGDVLVVKANTIRVTVLGKVARPGTYELPDTAGLVQALAAAGGLATGADGAAATLTRGAESIVVDLESSMTQMAVADGDVLFVPEAESRALVIGQVARPGAYDVKPGTRAMDVIAAAGGTLNTADRIAVFTAGDMTAARFEGSLAENPSISAGDIIEVKANTLRVTVLGSVARPGSYELQSGAGVLQALAAAGGITQTANVTAATLTRDGESAAANLDVTAEPTQLVDGDVLFVPQLELRATVSGQVARPGSYDLKTGARAIDLIAAAGGVLNRADKIAVYAGGNMLSPSFEGALADNPVINSGDVLVVKSNTVRVTVLGKVARPGTYELPDSAGLVQALAAAGGPVTGADGTAATLTRSGESAVVDLESNLTQVPVADGDVLFVPELQFRAMVIGQVARPGAYELKAGARVMDLIAVAGGVLNKADKIAVYAGGDMSSPSFEGSLADNPAINTGDVLVVKANTVRVTVLGKVARPGTYELPDGAGLAQVLAAAGGVAAGADTVATLTRDGQSLSINLDSATSIADGDVLFVPELESRAVVMGQVARPGAYDLKPGARATDLIAAAGGVLARADRIAVFRGGDMAAPVFDGSIADNPAIQPGDIVEVKPNTLRVTVLGKVARPGSYELPSDAGVVQALAAAGGLAVGANGAAATLTRAGESVSVDLESADLAATPIPMVDGDVLSVPELEFRAVVIGQVVRPGAYDLGPGARALDLIAAAGGVLDGADRIVVRASDATALTAPPRFEGAVSANPFLNPGDVVEVIPNTLRVTVLGEVARPGSYELKKGTRLTDALAAAGGLGPNAASGRIAQFAEGILEKPTYLSIDEGDNPPVADGDVIMVADRMIKVSVMGYVTRPGVYELPPDADLARALATAGGATADGDASRVNIAGATETRTIDVAAQGGRDVSLADGDVVHVPELTGRNVLVFGEVARPGAYKLPSGARLLDAIAAAGGATREASLDDVTISRDGDESGTPTFTGRVTENPQVNPGDVVHVGSRMISVTVMGKAARPGTYRILAGSRVIDAIAAAGGISSDGDRRSIVVAPTATSAAARTVNLDDVLANPAAAAPLSDGDVVMVPELRQQLAIMGEVTRPGVYAYSPGMTVLEALALAGGSTSHADLSKVRLYRANSPADAVLLEIADERLAFEGDVKANPTLMAGDILVVPTSLIRVQVAGHVSRPGEVQLRAGATVLDAVAAAGGLTAAADGSSAVITSRAEAQVRRADIDALLAAGGQAPAVRDGDVIFVPEAYRKVTVMGAVARPGLYDYKQGMRLIEALALAGGPSLEARLDKVLVYSGDAAEQVALGAANAKSIAPDPAGANNPALKAGDIVIVPQSDKIDWTAVSTILAIANSVKNLLKW